MIPVLAYVAPMVLAVMGSVALMVCYQALRLVLPDAEEFQRDPPVFSAGGCALLSHGSGVSKHDLLVTSRGPPSSQAVAFPVNSCEDKKLSPSASSATLSTGPFEDAMEPS